MSDGTRRILAGLAWFLASLGIMLSALGVWAYQSVLTTNGWADLTSEMLADPQVVEGTSQIVSQRVSDAVGLDARLAAILPGPAAALAPAISGRVEGFVADGIAAAMQTDVFRDVWERGNRAVHERAMNVIKGGGDVLSSEQGSFQLNVVPLVSAGLAKLQAVGVLPTGGRLPDLQGATPEEAVKAFETALGRDLPDDIGQIALVQSDRLAAIQQTVRNFEIFLVAVIVLTVVFALLALFLSRRRIRMVIWLALGATGSLLLARALGRTVLAQISGSLADGPEGETVRGVIDTVSNAITWFTGLAIILAIVIAILAWFADRRGRVTGGERVPVRQALRQRSTEILVAGVSLIAVLALWRVAGPDVALPVLFGLLILFAVVLWLRGGDRQETADSGAAPPAGPPAVPPVIPPAAPPAAPPSAPAGSSPG